MIGSPSLAGNLSAETTSLTNFHSDIHYYKRHLKFLGPEGSVVNSSTNYVWKAEDFVLRRRSSITARYCSIAAFAIILALEMLPAY